ncbi:DUF2381 family protein [Melittangium boletus]|uniref:Carboxypeptidase regulatory-like domain-containing protein n=1 Tax=Melittangium boletus DSM 14713 TaxID=1294270 RepID=A0A250IGL8_9BACT|nr:DUF2381 family protein [Melittangium boletus]ATB30302.1 hypothetical protein MEBOL_003762 [Melittangium boletus DSM 14713]
MRSVLCSALFLPLILASGPAAAQERPTGRVSRSRTLHVPMTADGTPPELHVAGGTATVISVDVPMGPEGPRIQDERGRFRLVPLEGSSFIILPNTDVLAGERPLLILPLQSGAPLQLALNSREDEVDAEVRLIPHQTPPPIEKAEGDMARLLNSSTEGAVELPLPKKRLVVIGRTRLWLKSVLRIEQRIFISLAVWDLPPSLPLEQQLLPCAVMKEGKVVTLPMFQVVALPSESPVQHRTLVTSLPDGAEQLTLRVSGDRTPDERISFPLRRAKPTP